MLRHFGGWCPLNAREAGTEAETEHGSEAPIVKCCDNFPALGRSDGLAAWVRYCQTPPAAEE